MARYITGDLIFEESKLLVILVILIGKFCPFYTLQSLKIFSRNLV